MYKSPPELVRESGRGPASGFGVAVSDVGGRGGGAPGGAGGGRGGGPLGGGGGFIYEADLTENYMSNTH